MKNQVTCYNCHFETEVNESQKRAFGQFTDWTFLINREGKVHPANIQSLTYQGRSFVAFAPFYAHSISRMGRECAECHESSAFLQCEQEGAIDVVRWDVAQGKLVPIQGVIPVVPDYETALRFEFADYVNGWWQYLKSGADGMHMLFGTPLTPEQMTGLGRY